LYIIIESQKPLQVFFFDYSNSCQVCFAYQEQESEDASLIRVVLTTKPEKKTEATEVKEANKHLPEPPTIHISELDPLPAQCVGAYDLWLPHGMDYYLTSHVTRGMDYLTVKPEYEQRPQELLPWPFLKYLRSGMNDICIDLPLIQ
jgi:hypothetical protein